MWRSFSIAKKIWVGLSILLIGYFGSMAFGFVLGQKTESRLQAASDYMFPAAIQSQVVLSLFNEQIRYYSEAVMSGDADILDEADQHASEVKKGLAAITGLSGLQDERLDEVRETMNRFEAFTTSAP